MPVHPNSMENLKKGKPFTKTYRPKNVGRRKDYLKEFIDKNRLSLNDLKIILENIIADHSFSDLETILAEGQKTLPAFVASYIKAMITDLKKGHVDTVEKIADRVYGKASQTNLVEIYDITDEAKNKMELIYKNIIKNGEEIPQSKNVLEQKDLVESGEEL